MSVPLSPSSLIYHTRTFFPSRHTNLLRNVVILLIRRYSGILSDGPNLHS